MIKKIILIIKKKLHLTNDIKEYKKRGVSIGNNTDIINCDIDYGHGYLISIGSNCTLTNCTLLSHDGSTKKALGKSKVGRINIGDNVFIGYHSIVLPNVSIGNNCIIGAGCVVSKNIPDNSVVVGCPCKIIGNTSDYINKNKELMKELPVFNTYWKNKTIEQKNKEKELLEDTFGYDE